MEKLFLSGGGYLAKHFARLESAGFSVTHASEPLSQRQIQNLIGEYSVYILGGDEKLTAAELKQASKLRLISFVGTGFTSFIDADEANELGISVLNTPEVMAPAVVEHTLGLILAVQRKLFEQNRSAATMTSELSGACVGIIGMGAIGSRLARLLRTGFGCRVIYYSRSRKRRLEDELGMEFASLTELFATSDLTVLALPTTAETENFIGEKELSACKVGGVLINTAGAKLVEPKALLLSLRSGHLASAAFDGYYLEPLPPCEEDPVGLLSLPSHQFVVTPHSAAKTVQTWSRMIDMAIDNVISFSRTWSKL